MKRGLLARWCVVFAILLGLLLSALWAMSTYALDRVTVTATWYGDPYHGRETTCHERFDKTAFTIACNWLPCGTVVRMSYGIHTVYARVNDRMHSKTRGWRIDVSEAVAMEMGWKDIGHVEMQLEVIQ